MRSHVCILAIFLLTFAGVFVHADESLEALIKRAETASNGERPGLYTEIAEQELRDADRLYNAGQADAGRAAVDSVVAYSDKACDATNQARNKIKNTEIAIRKMAAKLQAMGYEAYFYEPPAGGHGYGKDHGEQATFMSLGYAFLRRAIGWET